MANYQTRIEWLQAVVAEIDDLKQQGTTPEKELNKLVKLQAEEIETQALLAKQKAEYRKANGLTKRLGRSFKAATEAFQTEVEPTDTTEE